MSDEIIPATDDNRAKTPEELRPDDDDDEGGEEDDDGEPR